MRTQWRRVVAAVSVAIGLVVAIISTTSYLRSRDQPEPAPPRPQPTATPTPGNGDIPRAGDALGRRLSAVCAGVQAELLDLPRPPPDNLQARQNATKEADVLSELRDELGDELRGQRMDARRRRILKRYRSLLKRERAIDVLIVQAATADDDIALGAFADQNETNRAKRRRAALRLRALDCRPGPVVTR